MNTHHGSGSNENEGERGSEREGSEQILHTQDTKDHAQADVGNRVRKNVGDDVEGWLGEYSHDDRMAQTLTLSYETLRTFWCSDASKAVIEQSVISGDTWEEQRPSLADKL